MFRIKIGLFTTEIKINPKKSESPIKDILSGFLSNEKPDIFLNANLIDELKYSNYKGSSPAIKVSKDIYQINWYYFSGTFNTSTGRVDALINSRPYVLTSVLRMIYAIKAILSNGLFVHAASLVKENEGYLFPGKSGAGKSTLSKMATESNKNITILSDEISYISYERGKVFAYSTPFWGNTKVKGNYIRVPLKNIYFIKQSEKNYKREISHRKAVHYMLENILYASLDRESISHSFLSLQKILKKTDNHILYFTKDTRFLEVI